nr:hypothetical protein [Verrucomicrobium sp. BvORR034]
MEAALEGQPAAETTYQRAAETAMQGARPQSENAFKIELAGRCLIHALKLAAQPA